MWHYFGEYPVELGGIYYQSGLPCLAVRVTEMDAGVTIDKLRIHSWEPLSFDTLTSETLNIEDVESYIRERYL